MHGNVEAPGRTRDGAYGCRLVQRILILQQDDALVRVAAEVPGREVLGRVLWLVVQHDEERRLREDFWRRLADWREQLIVVFLELLCMLPGC